MSRQLAIESLEKDLKATYKKAQKEIDIKLAENWAEINRGGGDVTDLLKENARLEILKADIVAENIKAGARSKFLIDSNNKELLKFSILETQNKIGMEIGKAVDWEITNENAINSLFTESQSIYDVRALGNLENSEKLIRRLKNELATSTLLGEGIPELTIRIQNFTGRSFNDAIRIARTQSSRMYNSGRYFGYNDAQNLGIKMYKKWVSTYDGRTRKSHKEMQNEIVELNNEFSNGLRFPADPNGEASEVINCRCAISGVLDDYAEYKYSENYAKKDEIVDMMAEISDGWQ